MTFTYNIPTQTVSLEITPAEIRELNTIAVANIRDIFHKLAEEITHENPKPK